MEHLVSAGLFVALKKQAAQFNPVICTKDVRRVDLNHGTCREPRVRSIARFSLGRGLGCDKSGLYCWWLLSFLSDFHLTLSYYYYVYVCVVCVCFVCGHLCERWTLM